MNKYWLVTIKCKDRSKLLFDTVCTLADMDYDVYHATIDSVKGDAMQEYYIRPRLGKPGELTLRPLMSIIPMTRPRPVATLHFLGSMYDAGQCSLAINVKPGS